ncbi:MAG: HAD family hydrolase [Planctomycetota bacterium]
MVPSIPYPDIETVFLDAGNTLVSVDFEWVARELAARGVTCRVEDLERAECAARPVVSAALERLRSTEARGTFRFYLRAVLERLPANVLPAGPPEPLLDDLLAVLVVPGRSQRLWSRVLPGVEPALAAMARRGYRIVVVSNSDGSIAAGLAACGLDTHLDAIVDSHVVGIEKPDPRLFEHALALVGARPERTLHVGDMYHVDVLGARAAGLHAVLLDPHDDWGPLDCERAPDVAAVAGRLVP